MNDKVKVKVRVTLEYEIEADAGYASKEHIESRRNEGTYCWDNLIEELEALRDEQDEKGSCLCCLPKRPRFEVLTDETPVPSEEARHLARALKVWNAVYFSNTDLEPAINVTRFQDLLGLEAGADQWPDTAFFER